MQRQLACLSPNRNESERARSSPRRIDHSTPALPTSGLVGRAGGFLQFNARATECGRRLSPAESSRLALAPPSVAPVHTHAHSLLPSRPLRAPLASSSRQARTFYKIRPKAINWPHGSQKIREIITNELVSVFVQSVGRLHSSQLLMGKPLAGEESNRSIRRRRRTCVGTGVRRRACTAARSSGACAPSVLETACSCRAPCA